MAGIDNFIYPVINWRHLDCVSDKKGTAKATINIIHLVIREISMNGTTLDPQLLQTSPNNLFSHLFSLHQV